MEHDSRYPSIEDINTLRKTSNFLIEGKEVWHKSARPLKNYYEEYLVVEGRDKEKELPAIIVEDWQTLEYEGNGLAYDGIKENYWIRKEYKDVIIYLSHAAKVADIHSCTQDSLNYIHSIYKEWKHHQLNRLVDDDS